MTPFLQKKVFAAALRERMAAKIQEIQRRTQADDMNAEDVAQLIRNLLEQECWAAENVRWAKVHLFCERLEQVKDKKGAQQLDEQNPPLNPHQKMFAASVQQLDDYIADVERKLKALQTPNTTRLPLREIAMRTRTLTVYRDTMLKHCDSHYRDTREWTSRPA
jgi:hypothetical protein